MSGDMSDKNRDQTVERLLNRSLRTDHASTTSGPCLDAETLAAWMDQGLTEGQSAIALAHVSECSRCQAMVATLVKNPTVVQAPEPRWRLTLGWLVPLAAGAAAITLWLALPKNERPGVSEPTQVRKEAAPSRQSQEPVLPVLKDRDIAVATPSAASDERRKSGEIGQKAATKEAKVEAANAARRDAPELGARQEPSDRERAAATASQDTLDKRAASVPTAPPAPARAAESVAIAGSQPAFSRQTVAVREIISPDPSIRWRIGMAGSVQYSSNGGSTWEAVSTGVTVDLAAGASPSASVCWLVGRAGTVLLTTDGRRWQRIAFPEAVDLVAVQATDARTATVTADRRVFRTADGGATWDERPLQDF
jgi:hypothetical protein